MKKNSGKWVTRRKAYITFAVVMVLMLPGLFRLRINPDASEAIYPSRGVDAENHRRFLREFPGDTGSIIIVEGDWYSQEGWALLTELTGDLEALPVVRQVISLPNCQYVTGQGDTVTVEDFVDMDTGGKSRQQLATEYSPYQKVLVSKDGNATILYVVAEQGTDAVSFTNATEPFVTKYREHFRSLGATLWQSGEMPISYEMSRLVTKSSWLIGATMFIMGLVAWLLSRRLLVGILAALTGLLGVVLTFALMGYCGITENPVNALVVQLLIPLGASYVIYANQYSRAETPLIGGFIPLIAIPAFAFDLITTILGFFTTGISSVLSMVQFGLLGVFGITACLFVTLTVVLPLLTWLDERKGVARETKSDGTQAIQDARVLILPKWLTCLIIGAAIILTMIGWSKLVVDYVPVDYLLPNNQARQDFERSGKVFSLYSEQLTVFGDEPGDALDPKLWQELQKFCQKLERQFPGTITASLYTQVEKLHEAFNADNPSAEAFPDSAELIAQYLLLFDTVDTDPFIDSAQSNLVATLQVPFTRSTQQKMLDKEVEQFRKTSGLNVVLTGRAVRAYHAADLIARQNGASLLIGLVLVYLSFLVLMLHSAGRIIAWKHEISLTHGILLACKSRSICTRSLRVAFLAFIINAIPVTFCLAFLGLVEMSLDLGRSIVATVALGLVVNDTGHFMVNYCQLRSVGFSARKAAQRTIAELRRPVVITTLTIVVGFQVMNIAELVPFRTFSQLLSVTMLVAMCNDLYLLPALLTHFDKDREPGEKL